MTGQKTFTVYEKDVGRGRIAVYGRPSFRMMQHLKESGFDYMVTLLSESEGAKELGLATKSLGIDWLWYPMPNAKPPEDDQRLRLAELVMLISSLLDDGEHIFLHCSAGIHRTGIITYALLRYRGMTAADAKQLLEELRLVTAQGLNDARNVIAESIVLAAKQLSV